MNWTNFITLMVFVVSAFYTVQIGSVLFSKSRVLTPKGHRQLGISFVCLCISGLQLFGIFDFVKFISQ